MSDCSKMVVDIYNNPDVLNLISKIKPESLRDDLRQEVAVTLLEYPCERIASLYAGDNLLRYTMKVCWLMATSKTSQFFAKYRRNDFVKATEYLKSQIQLPSIPIHLAYKAQEIISKKDKDIYDDHEARLFNKYVELGSCRAVARYYGIPVNHTCNVISKVKKELKCMLQ